MKRYEIRLGNEFEGVGILHLKDTIRVYAWWDGANTGTPTYELPLSDFLKELGIEVDK